MDETEVRDHYKAITLKSNLSPAVEQIELKILLTNLVLRKTKRRNYFLVKKMILLPAFGVIFHLK